MVLTISTGITFSEPVAAANITVNSTMNNDQIQTIIDGAGLGDTINFLAGLYNNIALVVTDSLNLVGSDGAILNGDGTSPVLSIIGTNASGTNITGLVINGNGTSNGVSVWNTTDINIINNVFNNTNHSVSFSNVNESFVASNDIYNTLDYAISISDTGNLTSRNNVLIGGNTLVNVTGGIWIVGSGFNISNNYLDMNYGDLNGISGNNVYSALIQNNTLVNGDDGINIYQLYKNLTINNNTIINMTGGYADGISLVNHNTNKETDTFTTITNNHVENNNFGIFLGGNFQGNVSGNTLINSLVAGMNITGKKAATAGSLNANITNNNITNAANLGISMENPNVIYLNLDDNHIDSAGFSIQYNQYYRNNGTVIIGEGNTFSNPQNWIVNSTMTNDYIQSIVDGAQLGDTVTFLAGTYTNISLTISNTLNLVGNNGTILNSNGNSSVISIIGTNASGSNGTGFTINGNGANYGVNATNTWGINIANNIFNNTKRAIYFGGVNESSIQSNEIYNNTEYGIYIEKENGNLTSKNNVLINNNLLLNSTGGITIVGSGFTITNNYIDMYNQTSKNSISGNNVYSTLIQNNTLLNGGDGINIYALYKNLTIDGNTIEHMNGSFADGISLVNHGSNVETDTYTTITNNMVSDNNFGIFLGGHFTGNVSGNTLNNSRIAGINSTGKHNAVTGSLNANITNNNITNAVNLGISMENPNVIYLNLDNNIVNSDGFSIQYNQYYRNNGTVIIGGGNTFSNPQNFILNATTMNNTYIQSLINEAKSGDSITFLPGTYNNISLTLTKSLNLVGNGAILNSDGTYPVLSIIGTNTSGSNVTGFVINGTTSNAIGVFIQNSNNNSITNSAIQNNGWVGVCLDNSSGNTINGSNNITGNQEGMYLVNSSNNTIQGNNIHDNTGNGIDVLESSENNQIDSNTVSDNGGTGVFVRNSDTNTISNNTVQNNTWGVCLENSSGNSVNENVVSGNQEGVHITNSSDNTITTSTITGNSNIGIAIIDSSTGNDITSNTAISSNGVIGVYIRDSDTNTITGNTVESNGWVGVCLDNSSGNTISGSNTISGNQEGLYMVTNSNGNTIQGNNIQNNTDTGIYIESSTGNNITSNTAISSNGVIGILLRGADNNTISGNTMANNSWTGIALDNADGNSINGANIISGSQMGIYLVNYSNANTINLNTLQDNTWTGLVLDTAYNTQVYNNNFINNPVQAIAQNGEGNTFYNGSSGNYWSDWLISTPRPIDGNEGISDQYPSAVPF